MALLAAARRLAAVRCAALPAAASRRCLHAPSLAARATAAGGGGGGSGGRGASALALEDEVGDSFRVPNEPFDVMRRSVVTLEARSAEEAIAHVLTDSGVNGAW
jgi:hypothetical protein